MINRLLEKISGNKFIFFLIIFSFVLILRGPTLFNDYYEADELAAITQTRDYIAGYTPLVDFAESKNFLYHSIFKFSYNLSYEYGWVIVHFITILIVFLTSVFIFLTGKKIGSFKTGALAAMFYAVMISSFNRQFMATNGEIVYNLFFAMGLYFFIIFLESGFTKKIFFALLVVLMSLGAVSIKFHGLMFALFVLFFIVLYIPFRRWGLFSFYFGILCSAVLFVLIGLTAGYYSGNVPAAKAVNEVVSKLYYASAPGRSFSFLDFIARFSFRQGLLSLWHYVLWIPAFIYIWRFIKSGFKSAELKESAVLLFFICTWLMVLGGGARVYFHYFMAAYPSLVIVSALAIEKLQNNRVINNVKKNLTVLVMIPAVFFLVWNTKDIVIKHFFPDAFYKEGEILYWTRGVLIGTFNDYLLPHEDYRDTVDYIIHTTGKDDPVFVWGDGPYINYFSNRRIGGHSLWMKGSAYMIRDLYTTGDEKSLKKASAMESSLISLLSRKKPVLIVDVSENGLSNFKVNLKEAKVLYGYVEKNYYFDKKINGMDIYRLKK
ncbi:MAG TPA: hypothetical protein PLY36_04635 [Spirochaetota bacterium]|nr:hypothetical protein [Spirochaetota bacterium]